MRSSYPESLELLGFKQSDDSRCGPAVVRSVLYYYGIDATEDEIATRCNHTYDAGCTNGDIKAAFESYGLGAKIYHESTLETLEYWNRFRVLVIVDWFSGGVSPSLSDLPNGHASIVVGIDKNNVYLLDPENGRTRVLRREDFLRVWFDWETDNQIQSGTRMNIRTCIVPYPKLLDETP